METIEKFPSAIGKRNAQLKYFTIGTKVLRIKNMYQIVG